MDIDRNEQWRSCCSSRTTDSHLMKYMTQISVSSVILIFSIVQIARGDDKLEMYFSLISFIMGVYLPAPTHKKD